jgi:hypothetical protein
MAERSPAALVPKLMRKRGSFLLDDKGHQSATPFSVLPPTRGLAHYHTRQTGLRIIGEFGLQPKALANSGMFDTTPLTR